MLAGMKSEQVAGFVSESMAGFIGIRRETARELRIMPILQTLKDQCTEQHLAPGIDSPFLFREPGLQRLLPRLELRNAFGNGPSGHDQTLPLVTPGEPDPAFMARLAKACGFPCQAEQTAVGQVVVGNSHREAEIRRIEDSQGRTYELGPTRIAEDPHINADVTSWRSITSR
jgi:hypothetical protein